MVPAWKVSTKPNAELTNQMLDEYNQSLKNNEKPLIHSDRGVYYRWSAWINKMEKYGYMKSMSKKDTHQTMQLVRDFLGE